MKTIVALSIAVMLALSVVAAEEHHHDEGEAVAIKGEVVDLACYIDHGAKGDKHAGCAQKCIESGLPVGLKAEDGKTYVVIGQHEPMNKTLAPLAGKTVTLKGKVVSRDGLNMIANAELVK